MKRSFVETIIGAIVIAVAAIFLFYAYQNSSFAERTGYQVSARFLSVGGLSNGADVRIAGVKVGTVTALTLDQEDYLARVMLNIEEGIRLPDDTAVSITSEGLLGNKYVDLKPGASGTMLAAGGELSNTKDVDAIEDLLGRAIFLIADEADEGESGDTGGQ